MRVAVIGSGTMGHGIAQLSAMAGHEVRLHDVARSQLVWARQAITHSLAKLEGHRRIDEGSSLQVHERLQYLTDMEAAAERADILIEAVPEDLSIKQDSLLRGSRLAADTALLCTNTSQLSTTESASGQPPSCGIWSPLAMWGVRPA